MATPNDIAKHRKAERDAMPPEFRQAVALEQIADTLESIRTEFVGLTHLLAALSRKPGFPPTQ